SSYYADGELLEYLIAYYVDVNGNGIPEPWEIETRLVGKTQAQLVEIIGGLTFDQAGSDDLVAGPLSFRVASPYVEIEEIAPVHVGEPLVINGTSNREDGTIITVTVKAGPAYEKIPSATTEVRDGRWSVTLDTSDAEPGIYTVEAEDEDGNVDEATFELLPAVTPTPSPTPTPTPTPVNVTPTPPAAATPTPTPTPAATPSPTPPGFTAVFTIAGILAVAYLIIRRRK
ncbi:MAG: PGF-CTERM sorting domain-containing protein, partial [Candidatus Alkanophagales archaeon]